MRPLLLPLPAAAENVTLQQLGERFLLSWTLPQTNQDGSPLTDLQGFQVWRMVYDPAADCPECRDTSELWRQVDLDYLQQARRDGNQLSLWDAALTLGQGYQYRIVPFTRSGAEGAPALHRRALLPVPPPPTDLQAEGFDHLVRLAWQNPELPPGMNLLGYNLYRSLPEEMAALTPFNRSLLTAPAYEDFTTPNDQPFRYQVRSVVDIGGEEVESALSEAIRVQAAAGR